MHEMAIAVAIVEGVLEEAAQRGAPPVTAVHVRIGRLSGVDRDALAFAYEVACQETPLASSRLDIEDVPVVLFCGACAQEQPADASMLCARCGSPPARIVAGDELTIRGFEVAA
jgi:hydrogenase nickel incorporation protein HypA/HybF